MEDDTSWRRRQKTARKSVELSSSFAFPRHVNSAISLGKIDFYRRNKDKHDKSIPWIHPDSLHDLSSGKHNNVCIGAWMISKISEASVRTKANIQDKILHVCQVSQKIISLQLRALSSGLSHFRDNNHIPRIRQLKQNPKMLKHFTEKAFILNVHHHLIENPLR